LHKQGLSNEVEQLDWIEGQLPNPHTFYNKITDTRRENVRGKKNSHLHLTRTTALNFQHYVTAETAPGVTVTSRRRSGGGGERGSPLPADAKVVTENMVIVMVKMRWQQQTEEARLGVELAHLAGQA